MKNAQTCLVTVSYANIRSWQRHEDWQTPDPGWWVENSNFLQPIELYPTKQFEGMPANVNFIAGILGTDNYDFKQIGYKNVQQQLC